MAIPAYLNSSFRYLFTAAVTDVADIITAFRSETVTNGSPAWSEPSTNLFKSPVNSVNRWFDVLLTRVDATTLEMRVRNWTFATISTKRLQIDAGGTNIRIFSGECHFLIQADRSTPECLGGGFWDLSSMPQDSHPDNVYVGPAHRGTDNAIHQLRNWHIYANQWTGEAGRSGGLGIYMFDTGYAYALVTPSGATMFRPVEYAKDLAPQWNWGRRYQAVLCDSRFSAGAEFDVDIGDSTIATFQVTGIGTTGYEKIAMRVA